MVARYCSADRGLRRLTSRVVRRAASGVFSSWEMSATDCFSRSNARRSSSSVWVKSVVDRQQFEAQVVLPHRQAEVLLGHPADGVGELADRGDPAADQQPPADRQGGERQRADQGQVEPAARSSPPGSRAAAVDWSASRLSACVGEFGVQFRLAAGRPGRRRTAAGRTPRSMQHAAGRRPGPPDDRRTSGSRPGPATGPRGGPRSAALTTTRRTGTPPTCHRRA